MSGRLPARLELFTPGLRALPSAAAVFALFLSANGCSKKDEGPKVITLDGKVEEVDVRADGTGEITVLYYSEKQGQEVMGTARITTETEVMIDGVVASAKEIRVGERVRGDVRVDKKGDEKIQTVLKIYVDRPRGEG